MPVVTELVTKFGFKGAVTPLDEYNAGLKKSIVALGAMGAATFAAGALVAKWADGVLAGEQTLINLNAETGVAIERIQELGYMASVSNSSVEAMNSTLETLTQKIGEAAQKGSEDFSRLGISVRDASGNVKRADKVLLEAGNRFKSLRLSMAEQRSYSEALGIDASLITLLGKTSGEMEVMRKRAQSLGVLTKEQALQAQIYNDAITDLKFGLSGLSRQVAIALAPALMKLASAFLQLLADIKTFIKDGLQFMGKWLGIIGAAIESTKPFLVGLGAALAVATVYAYGGAIAFAVLTGAWHLFNAAVMITTGLFAVLTSPIALIIAGIVALWLAVHDLVAGLRGNKSYIRDFFNTFFDYDIAGMVERWTTRINEFFSSFDLIPDWVKDMFSGGSMAVDASIMPSGGDVAGVGGNVNQQVKIDIKTSDPVLAGEVAADSLNQQIKEAKSSSQRGGY